MFNTLMSLLGDEANEPVARFAADSVTEMVLNYCNIKTVPPGLKYTVARMAMDMYRYELSEDNVSIQGVSSVNVGDTSVSFGSSSEKELYLSGLIKDYKKQLNSYRRVGFK